MTREELFSLELPAWDDAAEAEVKNRWDRIAKPLDSLGEFERIFARLCQLSEPYGTVFTVEDGLIRVCLEQ